MQNIADIDPNFKIENTVKKDNLRFYNVRTEPFRIYGIFWEDGQFRRMPQSVADAVNDGVAFLNKNTAGGRVRFRTDSPYIAIHAEMKDIGKMPHFALTGSSGFDLYTEKNGHDLYYKSFVPPFDFTEGYESVVEFPDRKMRTVTINFPTYSGVAELFIGLDGDAAIEKAAPYKIEKPIVYYGSSITQGGCCSRPGNTYEAFVTQALHINHINLGFSGSARGEDAVSDYIKDLDMTLFVLDYDYNSPSAEALAATHEKLFRKVRAAQPELPIVILPRPAYFLTEEASQRFDIIKTTYDNAVKSGDKNVYLLTGRELMAMAQNSGTVDDCHPNDLGFASMAAALIKLLKTIL